MFKFNYKQVMLYYDQEVKVKSNETQIHASQTVTRDHHKELNAEDGDELLILAYTDEYSVITKQPIRVVGDDPENGSPDWTLESDIRDRLHITPGQKLKRWFTNVANVTPPTDPQPLPQRNLITNGGGEADPTNGTWLHASTQQLSDSTHSRDNVDGNISLRKTDSPYRQYLLLPTETELTFKAEFDEKSVEFSRTLKGNGSGVTLPINEREYLGVEPGNEVEVYIDTQSLVEAQAEEFPDKQTPSYAPDAEFTPATEHTTIHNNTQAKDTSDETNASESTNTTDTTSTVSTHGSERNATEQNTSDTTPDTDTETSTDDSGTTANTESPDEPGSEESSNRDVEPGDSWSREQSRYEDRLSNIANTELTPIVLLDERTHEEWPLHYTRSADNSTRKKTLCGHATPNVYEDTDGELSTTLCPDCLLTAFKENPEHHIDKVLTHLTGTTDSDDDGVEFTITSNEIVQLIECTIDN